MQDLGDQPGARALANLSGQRVARWILFLSASKNRRFHLGVMGVIWAAHLALQYAWYVPALREGLAGLLSYRFFVLYAPGLTLLGIYAILTFRLKGGLVAATLAIASSAPPIVSPHIAGLAGQAEVVRTLLAQIALVVAMDLLAALLYEVLSAELQRLLNLTAQVEETNGRLEGKSRELEEAVRALQDSRKRILKVQEEIRREMSERLHGPVQSRLLLATFWLREAESQWEAPSPEYASLIHRAIALIDDVNQTELRAIVRQLHPSIVRLGLVASLRSLADGYARGPQIDLQVTDGIQSIDKFGRSSLSEPLRLGIYRITEEALNNVAKYAQAAGVRVTLEQCTPETLQITIQDNGRGFDPDRTVPGVGLLSMQDYCDLLGGSLRIESRVGQGTAVIASFPLANGGGQGASHPSS